MSGNRTIFFECILVFCLLSACSGRLFSPPPLDATSSLQQAVLATRKLIQDDPEASEVLTGLTSLFKSRVEAEDVPFKHPVLTRFLSRPLDLEDIFLERLQPHNGPTGSVSPALEAFLTRLSRLWDEAGHVPEKGPLPSDISSLVSAFEHAMEKASRSIKRAFSGLTPEEVDRLVSGADPFLKSLCSGEKAHEDQMGFIALASRIKFNAFSDALREIIPFISTEGLEALKGIGRLAHPALSHDLGPDFEGDILYFSQTPIGLFIVGGNGPNVYKGDAAFILDLGGDDVYFNNAGSPVYDVEKGLIAGMGSGISVLIDLEGDDLYMSTRLGAQGSGILGIGILLDLAGDDVYSSATLGQGAGFLGIGVLADLAGNDIYSIQEAGQGAGVMGAGLLLDSSGHDRYGGAKFAQGFGGPGGLGMLIDMSGNDIYRAGVKYGSTYGTRNVSHTVSQGAAWGMRGKAAGGIGILEDLSGDDSYTAGNFSQGTGYYLGLGLLMDSAGNDRFTASRYCQGSAAHMASGILLDRGGNDLYFSTIAASKAGAWDLSAAWFLDLAGDDQYVGADLSLGASAQNGIALFLDASGEDRYKAPEMAFGLAGRIDYEDGRGARNLAIFLDRGSCTDIYDSKNVGNNIRLERGLKGIFLDE